MEEFKKIPDRHLPSREKFLINHGKTFEKISDFLTKECERLGILFVGYGQDTPRVGSKTEVRLFLTELDIVEKGPYKKGDRISWEKHHIERKWKPYPKNASIYDMLLMETEYEDEPTVEGEFVGFLMTRGNIFGVIATKEGLVNFEVDTGKEIFINGEYYDKQAP